MGDESFCNELKKVLGIEDDEYQLYGHFKNKIILKAQKDLDSETDIIFEIEEEKSIRKITSIIFLIYKNSKNSKFNKVCNDLLNKNTSLKNQVIINMPTGLFAKFYNQNLSFEQNFKDPMVGGAMKGAIHQAYPEAFIEYAAMIKRIKQLEK